MFRIKVNSAQETGRLAEMTAKLAERNLAVCLAGDLGAGKTLFSQCFCASLGVKEKVTSPTFNLMNVYEADGRIKRIYHFDLYRLENEDDLYEIGFYEYADVDGENAAVLIEWPDKFADCMPEDHLYVKIERCAHDGRGDEERIITVDVKGNKYLDLYKELERNCRF